MPEDVTINISEDSEPPPCPIEGHNWKAVVHNPYVCIPLQISFKTNIYAWTNLYRGNPCTCVLGWLACILAREH